MPVTATTNVQLLWREGGIARHFRSGVSLHSHTMYSEESLDGAAPFLANIPYLKRAIQRQEAEYRRTHGVSLDLQHGFWTPPLTPRQAHRLEEKQIQARFGLPALVSLTDHDDVRAGTQLRVLERFRSAPVSTEWTIPFGDTFFHLGVHNLPAGETGSIMQELAEYTARPQKSELLRVLDGLHARWDVLVVLNHPLWDEKGIGRERHEEVLRELLSTCDGRIHALEMNGLRTMGENRRVMAMGHTLNLPVVAGGDRHGLEPNAILNLSRSETLGGFIHEVRYERRSDVVFMPQYRQPQVLRIVHVVTDVLRDYPNNFEGRRNWADRVFYRDPETAAAVPFARVCSGRGTQIIRHLMAALRIVDRRPLSVILTSA
jgi:hypothetical protein